MFGVLSISELAKAPVPMATCYGHLLIRLNCVILAIILHTNLPLLLFHGMLAITPVIFLASTATISLSLVA